MDLASLALKVRETFQNPIRRKRLTIKTRALLLGTNREKKGFIATFMLYFVLTSISLVYVAPMVSLLSTSLKNFADLIDPTTQWVPKHFVFSNYIAAYQALSVTPKTLWIPGRTLWENLSRSTLFNSVSIVIPSALLQVFSCALAGYAFGRMNVPGKKFLFFILILEFIVPPQPQLIPMIWTYRNLKILNTLLVFYAPAALGHGLKGALFVFVYMQFFRKLPKELEEAAMIDGIGPFRMFTRVMLPLAKPAIVVVFLFALVFQWNDTLLTTAFYPANLTIATKLMTLKPVGDVTVVAQQPVQMAAGVIELAPLLIIYFFTQKWFTESIERTGLVE